MRTLHIEKLRGIKSLDFEVPYYPGAYLLTGANGAGKSTVLACLAQLGDPEALQRFFVPDICFTDSTAGNVFAETKIIYETEQGRVCYQFRDGKWSPDDSSAEQNVLRSFCFNDVIFTGARRKHYPAENEKFSIKDIKRVPDTVTSNLAVIFDDERFQHLHSITSKEDGREYFLYHRTHENQDFYYSENNFSAGQRSVLQLLMYLHRLPKKSFILIDEAEMALHPKAQKRLLEYLERTAKEKQHVILVSTQSASLIRITDPRNILFLENDENGTMICRRNVYPAAILGEMAIMEDILPEIMLFVEDPEAAMLLEAIVEKLHNNMDIQFPYIKILPVGGYLQVVILMDNMARVLPPYVKRRAVLDQDAERSIHKALTDPRASRHEVVARNHKNIYFLPCAPEQGVIQLLESAVRHHEAGIIKLFNSTPIPLSGIMNDPRYRDIGGDSRSDCKDKMTFIVRGISRYTDEPEILIRKKLYRYYADNYYRDLRDLKADYCSLIFGK
ncbi:MAG: ATP-binding protein [Lentisphaeria bacterium]|nr:ATP-binding protein [Lentisphaeria bacterium]